MIKSIKFKNFFSFNDTQVKFQANENIIVGINGSGKSNLLKAIHLLKEGVAGEGLKKIIYNRWGGFDNIFNFSTSKLDDTIDIIFEFSFEELRKYGFEFTESVFYQISIKQLPSTTNYYIYEKIYQVREDRPDWTYLEFDKGKGKIFEREEHKNKLGYYEDFDGQELALSKIYDPERYFALSTLYKSIQNLSVYDYFDTTPTSLMRKPMLPTLEKRLLSDGSNLPQILHTISINDKKSYRQITELLNKVNSNYTSIDFNFVGGNIQLMLEENKLNKSVHVTHISDGTLRFLCLLSIFYNPNRGALICIDEPEVGLHPDMIIILTEAIKFAATAGCQVLLATHSEHILNGFDLENIYVFEKDDNNQTIVNHYNEKDYENWYDEYLPGKMWRKGDIGGNRW